MVRREARSRGSAGVPSHSFNHWTLTRIDAFPGNQLNCRRKRRSFSKYRRMSFTP
jgi:hypothetical protein